MKNQPLNSGLSFSENETEFSLPQWCFELADEGAEPITAREFYTDIFQDHLAPHRTKDNYQTGEYTGIALEISREGTKTTHRTHITQDLSELWNIIDTSDQTCFIAPFSYAGKNRTNKNARYMYAMCIEIDGIKGAVGIGELFYSWRREVLPLPQPTYIVASGSGLHLYFVFEKPVPMYPKLFRQWSILKKQLTRTFWSTYVSTLAEHVQYESLNQAFRMPGTLTKSGARALAFRTGSKVTPQYMNHFAFEENRVDLTVKNEHTLEEAKELYPDWYQRRIINKEERGHFSRHEGIYHNWKQKIYFGATVGHRYNCLENLCALAVQCNIPRKQLVKDCQQLAIKFEQLTNKDDNHFTQYDIDSALRIYDNPNDNAYRRKVEIVSARTGIPLTRNRRNGRPQKVHLEIARGTQEIINRANGTDWRAGNGRKSKRDVVKKWRAENPNGKKIQCERETGLSRPTVLKWWDV